ncbi:class I SAM-dependent methyltransferase [Bauldia sp.]|uniref:class I SAM-dependent methyltransferase n=1 Tax=Bauldia sp. TaxID=2575872 RepID=UPI003BABD22D
MDRRKQIVADGYDQMADRYLEWTRDDPIRLRYLERLAELTPAGGRALDIGCGAGVPATRVLASRFDVIGIDLSEAQIVRARRNVPDAEFIRADIMDIEFPAGSFDAITAFLALTHLPRTELSTLLGRIHRWLRPGGIFLASLGAGNNPDSVEADWLGVPMFFSHFDANENQALVAEAGFDLLEANSVAHDEDGNMVSFFWVIARRPISPGNREM